MAFSHSPTPTGTTAAGATGPLNAFILLDYMTMIMKEGVKDALSEYRSTTVVPGATGPRSLAALASRYPESKQAPTGVSRVVQMARANQQLLLDTGAMLTFSGVSFVPASSSTLDGIAHQFGVAATALANFDVNPQLSFMPLPAGVTAVRLAGPGGATMIGVTGAASFQNLAQPRGITGAAINTSLLWPNLDVVSTLLVPGQTIQIPTFTRGLTGPTSLLSLASYYNLPVDALANQNASSPIFGPTAAIIVPYADRLTVGHLLDRLAARGFGRKTAGLSGRALLHGLRVPSPGDPTGPRQGLYEVTGQQVSLAGVTAGSLFELTYAGETAPTWLHFHASHGGGPSGATGATGPTKPSIKYPIGPIGLTQIQSLGGQTAYDPGGSVVRMDPFHIRERSFTLAHSITWNAPQNPIGPTGIVPAGPTGSYGTLSGMGGTAARLGNYFIRVFPERLQTLLQRSGAGGEGAISFTLGRQEIQSGQMTSSVSVTPYAWTTMLQLRVAKVPQKGGDRQELVYALEGTSETDKSLLARLLADHAVPQSIFLLYPATTAQAGQSSANIALVSDREPTVVIFQTNPSTAGGGGVAIDATDFLRQIWVGDQLDEAGIYLYYRAPSGKGLPEYLFAQQPTATVTLLVFYAVAANGPTDNPCYQLPAYVNSVVLDTAIQATSEGVFIRPVASAEGFNPALQTKTPAIHPGHVVFRISRPNPNYPPVPPAGALSATHLLDELYSIVEARVPGQTGWKASRPGLPIGPQNPEHVATVPQQFNYDVTFPIARLAAARAPRGPTGPSAGSDPYAGIGATLSVDFNLIDIFGNAYTRPGGGPWLSATTQPGYTDTLLGFDSWPHVAKSYTVDTPGRLAIELVFNAHYYYERYAAKEPVSSLLAAAQAAETTYAKIHYQLIQLDVVAMVSTSFDPKRRHDVTSALRQFVTACWVAVNGIVGMLQKSSPLEPMMPVKQVLSADLADSSGLDVLPLNVSLDITRTGMIDPHFADLPAVRRVVSHVAPMTSRGGTATNHLSGFATAFENAFPVFKVATGQSSASPRLAADASKGIWLVRLAPTAGAAGIYISLQDNPTYYAPRPVATSLVSRAKVPIYDIVKGETFKQTSNSTNRASYCKLKSYGALDLNTLAQQFLAAIDQALSPDMAAAAAIALPAEFQRLVQSKADIAALLSVAVEGGPNPLPPVYDDSNPPPGGTAAAGRMLESELLAELGRFSKVEAVVQCGVVCNWDNSTQSNETVEFFGKFAPRAEQAHPAFSFSSSTMSVTSGATASHVTSLFSLNQTRSNPLGATAAGEATFTDDVVFHITGFAHNIGASVVPGYKRADWLSFVRPFELGDRSAGGPTATGRQLHLDIPLPLRAYPTAPALKSQVDLPLAAQFGQAQGGTTAFKSATAWTYRYDYQYAGAAQDTILMTLDFNVVGATGYGAAPGPGTDFVNDLLQFKASYPALASDMTHLREFLWNNSAATTTAVAARLALTSFAQIARCVVRSWKTWQEYQKTYTHQYEIEQFAGPTGSSVLSVQVRKVKGPSGIYPHPDIPMPGIEIAGFITRPMPPLGHTAVGAGATCIDYTFEEIGATGPSYLRWQDRGQYPTRTVSFPGLNVLRQENAWAGLGVMRNKDLGKIPGTDRYRPVNPAFIFETPLVRFVNMLNPFLDPAGAILLPQQVTPNSATLTGYLSALFNRLLEDPPSTSSVLIKLGVSYGYTLGPGLLVELPMLLITPCEYNGARDPAFVNAVASRITTWLDNRNMAHASTTMAGSLVFDLTVFSTLSRSQLPILRLRNIELPCSSVNWT